MHGRSFFILAATAAPALADTHTLFAGFQSTGDRIVRLEFDDAANSLTLAENITAPGSVGQPWISFDSRKQNLYVLTTDSFQSYAITEELSLTYKSNISFPAECVDPFSGYISPASAEPYTVWATPWGINCTALAISVDDTGSLQEVVAEATFTPEATIHGTDLSADNTQLYSADLDGDAVWVHSFDAASNTVTEDQYLPAPAATGPRHLVVHPNQKWVYVLHQSNSSVAVYSRDTTTGLLTDTNTTYSMLPDSYTNSSDYSAAEVMVSSRTTTSPKYLFASTRTSNSNPGHVSAWNLDPDTGAITSVAFQRPTTGTGGGSHSVVPATFSENYFSLCDHKAQFVEIYQVADDGASADVVAHLDLDNGPGIAIWYD